MLPELSVINGSAILREPHPQQQMEKISCLNLKLESLTSTDSIMRNPRHKHKLPATADEGRETRHLIPEVGNASQPIPATSVSQMFSRMQAA